MTLKHIEGFDQYRGQSGSVLLNSLASAGFAVTTGLAMAAGRKPNSFALELQVSAGAGGASWSSRSNTVRADLHGVAANAAGRAVAVGDSGNATTSVDGIQWNGIALGVNKNLTAIKCHANTFIAVGDAGTILRSVDGQTWTLRTPPSATVNLKDIEWGDNKWVAVGAQGAVGAIFVSTDDGMTWSNVTADPGAKANLSVRFGDIWMVGGAGAQIITSDTALAWTARTFGGTADVNDVAFYNGTWLALDGRNVRRSVDKGVTWTSAITDVIPSGSLRAMAVSNGRWIAGGDNGALRMSDDGSVWTTPSFVGSGRPIYDVAVTSSANAAWYLVGGRAAGTTATAMIFVSLAPPTTVTRTLTTDAQKVVIGFAHRATARGRIFGIANLFNMDWPSGISILGVLGASVPIRNTDYYYEIVIDKTAGTLTLYTNDTLDLTAPLPAAAAAMTDYVMTWQAENGAVARIDDIYLLDSTTGPGAALVDRLKPISIPLRMPTADKAVTWDASSAGDHFPLIGLLPPSQSSYITSATSGAQDLFTSDTALPDGAGETATPIIAVGLVALAQKSDLDNRQLGLVIGDSTNQSEVIDTTLNITPEYSFAVFETAPGGAAWTKENVLTTSFGVAVRP